MNELTPRAARIVAHYADGEDARHLSLEPVEPELPTAVAPGQFLLLSVPGHGEAAFTYVRPPDARGRFDLLVRKVGSLTSALFALAPDALLGFRGPFGRGWPLAELTDRPTLVVAGGCGLAPLASAIDVLCTRGVPVALVYGSRTETTQVLARERGRWREELPCLETLDAPRDSAHLRGTPVDHFDRAFELLGTPPERALVCGPEPMMHATADALVTRGLDAAHVWLSLERRMHCGVGLCGHCYVADSYACVDGPTYRWDELRALLAKSPARPPRVTEIHHC